MKILPPTQEMVFQKNCIFQKIPLENKKCSLLQTTHKQTFNLSQCLQDRHFAYIAYKQYFPNKKLKIMILTTKIITTQKIILYFILPICHHLKIEHQMQNKQPHNSKKQKFYHHQSNTLKPAMLTPHQCNHIKTGFIVPALHHQKSKPIFPHLKKIMFYKNITLFNMQYQYSNTRSKYQQIRSYKYLPQLYNLKNPSWQLAYSQIKRHIQKKSKNFPLICVDTKNNYLQCITKLIYSLQQSKHICLLGNKAECRQSLYPCYKQIKMDNTAGTNLYNLSQIEQQKHKITD
eukprot:TRINITY_DN17282_c1_g1_i1.p1 TRINITY_DN17282_c1_g1~~TRINITY_DN17282_c1_g1_i1.p1  ORF type:complete len:289 (+),score=-15.82 TRINITY_DN17282_c1_g1_i1:73-939(+)